jgi:adenylate cyclase
MSGEFAALGNRLRIDTQRVDTHTDFPLWSERHDPEMKDVFEVQDEIARNIAEALRITLSPQEQAVLAATPTENLQFYDLYLRGKNYARRMTRQDLEFALQMFENAVSLDPNFAPSAGMEPTRTHDPAGRTTCHVRCRRYCLPETADQRPFPQGLLRRNHWGTHSH